MGNNWRRKKFLNTIPITIDDKEFDHWVGNKLDIKLGPWPSGTTPTLTVAAAGTQALDYLAMSMMLATSIGSNMMQFSQTVSPLQLQQGWQAMILPLPQKRVSTRVRSPSCGMRVAFATHNRFPPSGW
jgi:hypothetical protein